MISAKRDNQISSIDRHDGSAISNICTITHVANNQDNDCAWTWTIYYDILITVPTFVSSLTFLKKSFLRIFEPFNDSLLRILRETILFDYKMMQLVSQKLSACMTAVPIINSKKATLRPSFFFSMIRFCDIQNNWNPIFIISSH